MNARISHSLLFLLFLYTQSAYAMASTNTDLPGLGDLVAEGKIRVDIRSNGTHKGDCIEFEFQNLTQQALRFRIEPGRRLISDDTTVQDILLAREDVIAISAGGRTTGPGYGFCCQRSHAGPIEGMRFSVGRMASAALVRLAEHISVNDYPEKAVQNAVWAITDNQPIESIGHDDIKVVEGLRKEVAAILNAELPWYTTIYEEVDTVFFTGKYTYFDGEFNYYIMNNCLLTMVVHDSRSNLMLTLMEDDPHGPGYYQFMFHQYVGDWKPGEYIVLLYADKTTLIKELPFTLR